MERDAGLMGGFELDLVANRGGEGEASCEEQAQEQERKCEDRWEAGRMTNGEVNHGMSSLWIAA